MAIGDFVQVMGLQVSGDVGNVTIYTDRFGKKVTFPKTPPKHAPTYNQLYRRTLFAQAQRLWSDLTAEQKADWENLTRRASIAMTGQNLLIHVALKNDMAMLQTLMRQTGITVTPPPFINGAS
jgi:hypothetical protein